MPPVEAWQKVFVNDSKFSATVHAKLGCIACHGGASGAADKEAAHKGMVKVPASAQACASCHSKQSKAEPQSLHGSLNGYLEVLKQRSDPQHMPQVMKAYDNHCSKCHTTCGDCHVSRPNSVGGGLLDGHVFKKTPPMTLTCTGCHGSRINDEYKGKNKDANGKLISADVHYNPKGMTCTKCHTADAMHGTAGEFKNRYDGPQQPSCTQTGCHDKVAPGSNPQHTDKHLQNLACQVCHSVQYKNCDSCHVQLSEKGEPFYKIKPSEMGFRIGLNSIKSESRPYKYVPLRHVPIDRESFAYYGDNLLPNFDSRPTWAYATPHNIQRKTPQNESCDKCHGNKSLFLTEDAVAPDERVANKDVIVRQLP